MGNIDSNNTAARTDTVERLPRWGAKLAHRLAMLDKSCVHTLVIIVPKDGSEPQWSVQSSTKIEN